MEADDIRPLVRPRHVAGHQMKAAGVIQFVAVIAVMVWLAPMISVRAAVVVSVCAGFVSSEIAAACWRPPLALSHRRLRRELRRGRVKRLGR